MLHTVLSKIQANVRIYGHTKERELDRQAGVQVNLIPDRSRARTRRTKHSRANHRTAHVLGCYPRKPSKDDEPEDTAQEEEQSPLKPAKTHA